MKRKILITGFDSGLKAKLVKLFLDGGYKVAATVNTQSIKTNSNNSNFIEIPWNNRSPLSAKDIILECQNKMEGFDDALTIFSSQKNNKPIHEISSAEIESSIDSSLKGNLFILKEIILYFQRIGKGNISLIHDLEQSEILAPLYAVEAGGLSSLARSLFASYQNEQLTINSYRSNSGELTDYAEYIFNSINERTKPVHGKIFKFQAKGRPFFLS
ncbi:MAG: SDR family NAD(P)-dependent oxidoreductase [Spirochaetales bacterium]|nr:SDR family NAD(P)-dependent oxidoreductase [Spirochaetales bacterium]